MTLPDDPGRRRVLDIGCGSGILGIAAAQSSRGCRVTAVDVDPGACHAARENARHNRAADPEESLKTAGLRVERRRSEAGWSCVTVCKGAGLRPPGSG
ncbi:MAG: 50S ribosomal protein L11 methyltransferase [Candidatus Tectomicrobia bacterium]|nr:50S ribosomal protein L11 methyltransferase [Candidatus Tectomicrobia bacterium]